MYSIRCLCTKWWVYKSFTALTGSNRQTLLCTFCSLGDGELGSQMRPVGVLNSASGALPIPHFISTTVSWGGGGPVALPAPWQPTRANSAEKRGGGAMPCWSAGEGNSPTRARQEHGLHHESLSLPNGSEACTTAHLNTLPSSSVVQVQVFTGKHRYGPKPHRCLQVQITNSRE